MKDFQQFMQPDSPFFVIFIVIILFIIASIIIVNRLASYADRIDLLEAIVREGDDIDEENINKSLVSIHKRISVLSNKVAEQSANLETLSKEQEKIKSLFIEYLESRIKLTKQNQEKHGEQPATTSPFDSSNSRGNYDTN